MFSFTYLTYVHMFELLPSITSLSIELIVVTSLNKVIISHLVKQNFIFVLVWLWIIQALYHTLFPKITGTFLKPQAPLPWETTFAYLGVTFKPVGYLDPEELIRHNIQKVLARMNVLPAFGIKPLCFLQASLSQILREHCMSTARIRFGHQ